jgi:hypothetical protein
VRDRGVGREVFFFFLVLGFWVWVFGFWGLGFGFGVLAGEIMHTV